MGTYRSQRQDREENNESDISGENSVEPEKDSSTSITLAQVAAAAIASTIGAIVVRELGFWGTIIGTAILSVCATVGSVLVLQGMHRTHSTIKRTHSTIKDVLPKKADGSQGETVASDPSVSGAGTMPKAAGVTTVVTPMGPVSFKDNAPENRIVGSAKVPQSPTAQYPVPPRATSTDHSSVPKIGSGKKKLTPNRKRTLISIAVASILVFALTMAILYVASVITGTDLVPKTQNPIVESSVPPTEDPTSAVPTQSDSPSETSSPTATESDSQSPSSDPSTDTSSESSSAQPSDDPSSESVSVSPSDSEEST